MEGGQTQCQETIHRNLSYLFMQQSSIEETPSLIMKCVFAKAHTAKQLLLESLCLSTPLAFFSSLDHITLGKQCHASFIYRYYKQTLKLAMTPIQQFSNPSWAQLWISHHVEVVCMRLHGDRYFAFKKFRAKVWTGLNCVYLL